jgi:hypothetical protein
VRTLAVGVVEHGEEAEAPVAAVQGEAKAPAVAVVQEDAEAPAVGVQVEELGGSPGGGATRAGGSYGGGSGKSSAGVVVRVAVASGMSQLSSPPSQPQRSSRRFVAISNRFKDMCKGNVCTWSIRTFCLVHFVFYF